MSFEDNIAKEVLKCRKLFKTKSDRLIYIKRVNQMVSAHIFHCHDELRIKAQFPQRGVFRDCLCDRAERRLN